MFLNTINIIERSLYVKYIRTLNHFYMARTFKVIPQFNTDVLLSNDDILLFQAGQDPANKKQCS